MAKILILRADACDVKLMDEGQGLLRDFRVPYAVRLGSAQLAPDFVKDVVSGFQKNGGQVIICLAAPQDRLASLVSSLTQLPVLNVLLSSQSITLDQLPGSIPVATLGSGSQGFSQAALFALQLLALHDIELDQNLQRYRHSLAARLIAADQKQQVTFHV